MRFYFFPSIRILLYKLVEDSTDAGACSRGGKDAKWGKRTRFIGLWRIKMSAYSCILAHLIEFIL